MSTISEEDHHELRMQAAVDKVLKKQAKVVEADALRRIDAAKAQALTSVKFSSPLAKHALFRISSSTNPSPPSLTASSASPSAPTQQELEKALNLRVAQQQSQEVAWYKRAAPKASTGSVTLLLSDYDVYKKANGTRTLHE